MARRGRRRPDWAEKTKQASLDDTIYVLTPQGKVIDLPAGATPVDFAYALHTDLGHRCRGAKVDGHIVPLDTPLTSGQRVEIIAAKRGPAGRPSRDWLNPALGFVKSPARAARSASGSTRRRSPKPSRRAAPRWRRSRGARARAGDLEELAQKLGFGKPDELFAAVARDEVNLRQLQAALRELAGVASIARPAIAIRKRKPRRSRRTAAACSSSAWTAC